MLANNIGWLAKWTPYLLPDAIHCCLCFPFNCVYPTSYTQTLCLIMVSGVKVRKSIDTELYRVCYQQLLGLIGQCEGSKSLRATGHLCVDSTCIYSVHPPGRSYIFNNNVVYRYIKNMLIKHSIVDTNLLTWTNINISLLTFK